MTPGPIKTLLAAALFVSTASGALAAGLQIAIRPGSEAGGLNLRSPHCPGDVFDFRTCEGVVVGSRDFGLFQVKLPAAFGDGRKSWRRDGDRWSYSWPYAQGVTVHVAVEPDGDSLKLAYTLENVGTNTLEAVQLHTCIPTTEAPGFFPPPTVTPAQTNWSELYGRLHVWSGEREFSFASTTLAASEPHLSLVQTGHPPVKWGWWVNGPERFDPPLIALASRDRRTTITLAFERAIWASSNTGDDRACFHLFPWFGRIEPGRSVTVRGRLYVLPGSPQETLRRFQEDFPKPAAEGALLEMPWHPQPGSRFPTADSPANPPYPDVQEMIREPLANVAQGTVACGWEALRYRMRGNIYQSNADRLDDTRLTQFERLVRGDPEDVAAVNREIVDYCTRKQAEIEAAWHDPKRRHPAKEVCAYQTELIPLAILPLRIGGRLTPEAHQSIKEVLTTFRPQTADVEPTLWMHGPGYNGANAHDYLSFLALTWAVTGNPEVRDAAYWGLRGELDHLNLSGDISEFNVLEGHWCSSNGYDAMKAFVKDPELARMARMIAERLWLNRFLMWSPVVERITGPGSRMAPGAWFGTSSDRLQFATGVEKPIWLNEFFDWGVWKLSPAGGRWSLDDVQGMVPDLPAYLQDVAWRKQFPNDLRCSVQLILWMDRYPKLPGISNARPDPVLGEIINYQTAQYAVGSINHPYEASSCMVYASAWWNDTRAPQEAPLGSPKRLAALYPHYVFNGASFMDRTELHFENHPDQPVKDGWTGLPGPWMREFAEQGRAGVLQHKNTLLYTYSGRNRGHDDVRPVASKLHRVSAGMFLFRWQPGLEGLHVNREPVTRLPLELKSGDWWFIHDGETYAGIRPLEATALRGPCKTTLEERTRQIVLYQDNYAGETIDGINDEEWVKARSGFLVEMGDAAEYGSFERFRDLMLAATVSESADGFVRHIRYERPGRQLEMKWHCYEEKYLVRRADGQDQPAVRHLQSPEFAVGTTELHTHDASLKTALGETAWLLSAAPSKTYVAYQPQPHIHVPISLETPIARIESDRFPFGKLVARQAEDDTLALEIDAAFRPFWSSAHWRAKIWQDLGTYPGDIRIRTDAPKVTALINGDTMPVAREVREGQTVWVLDPYARLPRVRDRVGGTRPVTK